MPRFLVIAAASGIGQATVSLLEAAVNLRQYGAISIAA